MNLNNFYNDTVTLRGLRQQVVKVLDQYALSYGEFEIIYYLSANERSQPTMISASLNCERASVSRVIKLLHEKGLIKYEYDDDDRRRVFISISSKGKKMLVSVEAASIFDDVKS